MKTCALVLFLVSAALAGAPPEPRITIVDFSPSTMRIEVYDETHLHVCLVGEAGDTLVVAMWFVDEETVALYKTQKKAKQTATKATVLQAILEALEKSVQDDK